MDSSEPSNLSYRIYRMRRLLGLFAGFQALGLIAAFALGGGPWMPGLAAVAVLSWGLCVTLQLRFPHGWIDCTCLAAVLGALWAFAPGWFSAGIAPQVVLGMAITGLFAWLSLVWLVCTFAPGLGRTERRFEASWFYPHPLAVVKEELEDTKPGCRRGPWTVGQPNADGFIPVTLDLGDAAQYAAPESTKPTANTYFIKVLEDSETHQITLATLAALDGGRASSVTETRFAAVEGGTLVTMKEVSDALDLLSAFGFWMNDYLADTLTAVEDRLNGLPDRSIRNTPVETPMVALAKSLALEAAPGKNE